MSFSNIIKTEIVENKSLRLRHKYAQAYGLFLFGRNFSVDEVSLSTGHADVAETFEWFVQSLAGRSAQVARKEYSRREKMVFELSVPHRSDRKALLTAFEHQAGGFNEGLLQGREEMHAFLTGAFLSCGNITDPQKSYHLEFICKDILLSNHLYEILNQCTGGVRRTTRRGAQILYYKECAEIEDLLTLMGAVKGCLAMIEVEMIQGLRNQINRVTNCETANIGKTVGAAQHYIEDIELIFARKGEDWLPENLRQIARLRVENPDLSLRELAELNPTPISRSGVHHRLEKLSRMAEELRDAPQIEEEIDV